MEVLKRFLNFWTEKVAAPSEDLVWQTGFGQFFVGRCEAHHAAHLHEQIKTPVVKVQGQLCLVSLPLAEGNRGGEQGNGRGR